MAQLRTHWWAQSTHYIRAHWWWLAVWHSTHYIRAHWWGLAVWHSTHYIRAHWWWLAVFTNVEHSHCYIINFTVFDCVVFQLPHVLGDEIIFAPDPNNDSHTYWEMKLSLHLTQQRLPHVLGDEIIFAPDPTTTPTRTGRWNYLCTWPNNDSHTYWEMKLSLHLTQQRLPQ